MNKRILLINSDLAKNRGDRAIAEGNVALIKQRFPDASITGISQYPERDTKWYGIDFLDMDFQSINPFELLRLCRIARQHDIVLWGGGEILKDYTNKAALWYWVIKITAISMANSNIYGAYQGVGPTSSAFSKRLIAYVVGRCKVFIVRDDESYDKLLSWGVDESRLEAASDPAVLPEPTAIDTKLADTLSKEFGLNDEFLRDFICIGPRDWFHYKRGGIIPYKYKKRVDSLLGKSESAETPEHREYIKQLELLVSELTNELGRNVLLVPMHMEENDTDLCNRMARNADDPSRVRVIDSDVLSPSELRSLVARAQAMIGFRLHSNIIGISAGVPSINIYYVDKGRVFFDQINQQRFALPIENVLKPGFIQTIRVMLDELLLDREAIHDDIRVSTKTLRQRVTDSFGKAFPR